MLNIHTLIFDLGGVIINLKPENTWLEEDLLPNFHPERLQQLQQDNYFHNFEKGEVEVTDFIRQLQEIAIGEISEEKIIQHWNGILLDIPQHRVEMLRKLAKQYRLILLSNTNHIHMDFIRAHMHQEFEEDILQSVFHTCYFSQEIGLRKPGKEIYDFVIKEQNIEPAGVLFLDDKAENLSEAAKLGIRTFHVDFNKLSINDLKHLL